MEQIVVSGTAIKCFMNYAQDPYSPPLWKKLTIFSYSNPYPSSGNTWCVYSNAAWQVSGHWPEISYSANSMGFILYYHPYLELFLLCSMLLLKFTNSLGRPWHKPDENYFGVQMENTAWHQFMTMNLFSEDFPEDGGNWPWGTRLTWSLSCCGIDTVLGLWTNLTPLVNHKVLTSFGLFWVETKIGH